jgi:ribonuclease P protein component
VLSKPHRLCRDRDYRAVYAQRRSFADSLIAFYIGETEYPGVRVGIVAGKKVGRAVVRNKVRRRLKAIMRERVSQVPSSRDIVIVARKASAEAAFENLAASVDRGFKRLGIAVEVER